MREPYGIRAEVTANTVCVSHSRGLTDYPLRDASGNVIATIHGQLLTGFVGAGMRFASDAVIADFTISSAEEFEKRIVDNLHGNIAIITSSPVIGRRLYTDYATALSIVYDPGKKLFASSAALMFEDDEYDARLLRDRVRRIVLSEGKQGWICGTLTAHQGLFRLLPNHYLDLESFTQHRFWPREDDFPLWMDFEEAARICAADIRSYVEAAVSQFDISVALTAGYDSRIVLAAARNVVDQVEAYTLHHRTLNIDAVLAPEIAGHLGVRHRLIPLTQTSEEEKLWWDHCVGHCVKEVSRDIFPSLKLIPGNLNLSGICGETGRNRLYQKDWRTINDRKLKAKTVLWRLALPSDPELVENVQNWLDELSWLAPSAVLDLAHVELKIGSWCMGQGPAQKAILPVMMPLGQRRVQDAMIRVNPAAKDNGALFHRIGELNWPEAMAFPVNRFGDYRDLLAKIRKLGNPQKVRQYLREHLS